jgi:hypothetical protein
MQSSSVVRWETATQHFTASITGQINAPIVDPASKFKEGRHLCPFANFGNVLWTTEYTWHTNHHSTNMESILDRSASSDIW